MKVLFHVDELEKWQMTLENAGNMLDYGTDNAAEFEIEIVANSIAVTGLMKEKEAASAPNRLYPAMQELARKGVTFAACRNALRKFNPNGLPLYEFAVTVPAGVVEIAARQQEGYSYIKP